MWSARTPLGVLAEWRKVGVSWRKHGRMQWRKQTFQQPYDVRIYLVHHMCMCMYVYTIPDRQTDRQTDGQMDRWTNRQIDR